MLNRRFFVLELKRFSNYAKDINQVEIIYSGTVNDLHLISTIFCENLELIQLCNYNYIIYKLALQEGLSGHAVTMLSS